VVVPANVKPGQQFCARIGTDGPLMNVFCPENCGPGTTLQVRLPKVALPRPKNLPNPHASDSEQGETERIKDHRSPSECALRSNEGRCGASDVQEDGNATAATQGSSSAIPGPSAGGQDGGSRRTSGRARNSISYDENKWRIRHGPNADSITVRQDIDLHAYAGHTSMMPSIQRTASDTPDDGALHEQYGNARMQSFSAPVSSSTSAPASRGPAAGVMFDDIPPAARDTDPLVSLSLGVYHFSLLSLHSAVCLCVLPCVYVCACPSIMCGSGTKEEVNHRLTRVYARVAPLLVSMRALKDESPPVSMHAMCSTCAICSMCTCWCTDYARGWRGEDKQAIEENRLAERRKRHEPERTEVVIWSVRRWLSGAGDECLYACVSTRGLATRGYLRVGVYTWLSGAQDKWLSGAQDNPHSFR
jgi:hypothetical protein